MAGRPFPPLETYGAVAQHDNGIGMARAFEASFEAPDEPEDEKGPAVSSGPSKAPRLSATGATGPGAASACSPERGAGITILTGEYGARVLAPLLVAWPGDVEVVVVRNEFFGGKHRRGRVTDRCGPGQRPGHFA